MFEFKVPENFKDVLNFSLMEALTGRRSRRFFMGAEIPDGIFQYKSKHAPMPLSNFEKLLLLTACGGNTGWHNMIYRGANYAPELSNYSGAAGGRTFPSAAGFHTSKTFFTDDEGVYVLDVRDAPSLVDKDSQGRFEIEQLLKENAKYIKRLSDQRLYLPSEPPYIEPHNTWVANKPGTFLVIPVGDLSQHVLLALCYMLQNNTVITDDINGRPIPGIEKFKDIVDIENAWPITFLEQWSLSELTVELSTSCYAGCLMLQAMGLGGWMFNGVDIFSVLGASGDPKVPGLGFRYDENDKWPYPNPTGLEGILEGYCPPHYPTMRDAVDALCERKFGEGGPFNPHTPGPWKQSAKVRGAAKPHDEAFRECVALQAQYIFDTFGKFPGTVPSMFISMFFQAFHLDLDFYNHFYSPGAYLQSHAEHMEKWHK